MFEDSTNDCGVIDQRDYVHRRNERIELRRRRNADLQPAGDVVLHLLREALVGHRDGGYPVQVDNLARTGQYRDRTLQSLATNAKSAGLSDCERGAMARSMMAVRLFEYGGPEVLKYVEVPVPEAGPDEVLVRVRATSLTRWDLRYRQGLLTPPPGRAPLPLPFQLGREAAGEVEAVGSQVRDFRPGDRVVAMTCPACGRCEYCQRGLDNLCVDVGLPGHQRFGAYAQYVCRKESELLHAPETVSFEKLACLLWSYGTVWHMAIERGRLQAGQHVLITAASGGMGTAAMQIARLAGARSIIAVTGSAKKVAPLLRLGATHVLNYREENMPQRVLDLTLGHGVDLALENVGGEMLPLCMACLRMDGTLVAAGQHGGRYCTVDVELLYRRHLNVLGTRGATRLEQKHVLELAGEGKLDPAVSHVLPLEQAVEAHRILESEEQLGKIVLLP